MIHTVRIVPLIVLLLLLVNACGRGEPTSSVLSDEASNNALSSEMTESPPAADAQVEVGVAEVAKEDLVQQDVKLVKVYKSPT